MQFYFYLLNQKPTATCLKILMPSYFTTNNQHQHVNSLNLSDFKRMKAGLHPTILRNIVFEYIIKWFYYCHHSRDYNIDVSDKKHESSPNAFIKTVSTISNINHKSNPVTHLLLFLRNFNVYTKTQVFQPNIYSN